MPRCCACTCVRDWLKIQWQKKRLQQVDQVTKLSIQLMNIRLPLHEQAELKADEKFEISGDERQRVEKMDWLFGEDEA